MKGQGGSGFSAMVLFIAAALTAAIAATVIIGATTSAQGRAAAAAQQTIQTSGTTVEIVRVEGVEVNTTSQQVQKFLLYTRLAPGSQPILLNQTAVIFYAPSGRQMFVYGGAVANSNVSLGTSQTWQFSIIPPNGQPYNLLGVTPAAMIYPTVILYG
jgi:archaellin